MGSTSPRAPIAENRIHKTHKTKLVRYRPFFLPHVRPPEKKKKWKESGLNHISLDVVKFYPHSLFIPIAPHYFITLQHEIYCNSNIGFSCQFWLWKGYYGHGQPRRWCITNDIWTQSSTLHFSIRKGESPC